MRTAVAPEWVRTLKWLGVAPRSAVVAGEDARLVARALHSIDFPPTAFEREGFAMLGEPADAAESLASVPDGALGLVILRMAWRSPSDLVSALREGRRALEPGGRLVVAELDVARLLEGPTLQYPSRLIYRAEPELTRRLEAAVVGKTGLGSEITRAGLKGLVGLDVDEERGDYPSAEDYWEALREEGWRFAATLTPERREELVEWVAGQLRALAPMGRLVDREPWHLVTGLKP